MNTPSEVSAVPNLKHDTSYTVLIVDDDAGIRKLIKRICESMGWSVGEACSGLEALDQLKQRQYQIFVIDVNMPGPSGIELAGLVMEQEESCAIMILTGYAEVDRAVDAVRQGVCNYVQKGEINIAKLRQLLQEAAAFYEARKLDASQKKRNEERQKITELTKSQLQSIFEVSSDILLVMEKESGRIVDCNPAGLNVLGYTKSEVMLQTVFQLFDALNPSQWKSLYAEIVNDPSKVREFELVNQNGQTIPAEISFGHVNLLGIEYISAVARDITERREHLKQLRETLTNTIHLVALTVEKRDPYTAGHQKRVAQLSKAIAERMNLAPDAIEGVYMGGLIHDVGKIGIPSEILSKPGTLYEEEFNLIKLHPQMGYEIIKDIQFPWPIHEMVMQHHERLDGSGYPMRMKEVEIILEAKIMGVADVVEAVSSHRPYRPALGVETALGIVQNEKGTRFVPEIVDTCCDLFETHAFAFDY